LSLQLFGVDFNKKLQLLNTREGKEEEEKDGELVEV